MDTFETAHYFPLSSQGNIYTMSILNLANNTNTLLVATLRREVIYFEYNENSSGVLIPTAKEITFTYLPSGAEIISMTAFNKSAKSNDFVIGITIIKNSSDLNALETYLNIYSGWEESVEFNMESISQNCLNNIELKFIPYHLTHTNLITWSNDEFVSKEVVFLLSGSDNKIHIFQENKSKHAYKEIEYKDCFPEFYKPPSVVMWVDVHYYNNFEERITAFGCECGYMRMCRVNTKTNKITFNYSTRFNNTISMVKLYEEKCQIKKPDFTKDEFNTSTTEETSDCVLNLVVVNTILPSVFFSDVVKYGLRKYGSLPRIDRNGVSTCVEIADINFDGNKEILIGDSRQEMAAYEFDKKQGWCIKAVKDFATPVLSVKYIDITGDGVKELVVLTMKGVNILQHNHEYVQKTLEEKCKSLSIPNIENLSLDK